MAIRNDYLTDMIMRFAQTLTCGLEKSLTGAINGAAAQDGCEQVVGEVLDMDAQTALALSPASLVTMMQISAVDDRLAVYVAYCLERLAGLAEGADDALASVRRDQAQAVAAAYGIAAGTVPPEVQQALAAQQG